MNRAAINNILITVANVIWAGILHTFGANPWIIAAAPIVSPMLVSWAQLSKSPLVPAAAALQGAGRPADGRTERVGPPSAFEG